MKKLTFPEINDLVVKHTNATFFGQDLELFKKHFPSHTLNNDLARANQFTHCSLDGQMLFILLGSLSIDDILKNRKKESEIKITPKTIEEIKEIIVSKTKMTASFLEKRDTQDLEYLANYTEEEIVTIVNSAIDNRSQQVILLLRTTFGYGEDMINTLPEGYILKLVLEADTDTKVFELEQQRINESKPASIEELKAILRAEFNLSEEDLAKIPEETLTFFMRRSKSEIIIGYEHLLSLPTDTKEKITVETHNTSSTESTRANAKTFQQRITDAKTIEEVNIILQEDKAGGERKTVQDVGAKRIIELTPQIEDTQDKKKEQS